MKHPLPRDISLHPSWHQGTMARGVVPWIPLIDSVRQLRNPVEAIEWIRRNAERPILALRRATTAEQQYRINMTTQIVIRIMADLCRRWYQAAGTSREKIVIERMKEAIEDYDERFLREVERITGQDLTKYRTRKRQR
jgi:hypothetical protein